MPLSAIADRVVGVEMSVTRAIERPADEVFGFLSDAANNPRWQNGMRSCAWTSEPPIAVGSTYRQHARFLGRDVLSTFVVATYEPDRRIVIESVESTFPIQVDRSVAATGPDSCRVTAVVTGGPSGRVALLLGPLLGRMAQRSIDGDYDRLVSLMESTANP